MMKVNDQGEFLLSVEEVLESEDVKKELTKHALFDEMLVTAIVQWLLNDQIVWEEGGAPWWVGSSGQSRISKVRHALLPLVDEILRNEVIRTRQECDRAKEQAQESYGDMRDVERMLPHVYNLGYKHGESKKEKLWPQTTGMFKTAITDKIGRW